jgi:hypothetical protein
VRAIARETVIPPSAVQRAKQQIEKAQKVERVEKQQYHDRCTAPRQGRTVPAGSISLRATTPRCRRTALDCQ